MELGITHKSHDQNYLFFLLNMPQFNFSCLISDNQKNWIYPDSGLCLKLCTWTQMHWLSAVAGWTSASILRDDRRPMEGETKWTQQSIVRNWKLARALLQSLPIFHFFSDTQPYSSKDISHLGIFQRDSLLIRIIAPCWHPLNFGLRITDRDLFFVIQASLAVLPKYTQINVAIGK